MKLLGRLLAGELGLATTYWLYGVGGSLLLGTVIRAIRPVPGTSLARILVLGAALLLVPVLIGVWRAAGLYQGRRAWVLAARAAVGLSVVLFYLPLLGTLLLE